MFITSIKTWRKFHVVVVQRQQRKVLCLSKPLLAFLPFALLSPALSLKPAIFKLSGPGCFESRVWTTENYCLGMLTITQPVEPFCTPALGAFRYREHWAQRERKYVGGGEGGFLFFPLSDFAPLPSIWTSRQTVSRKSTAHTQYLFNSQNC